MTHNFLEHIATVWFECFIERKILTNGVISDFDEENFDKSFCLSVKRAIILLLLLLYVLVAVIVISHHVHVYVATPVGHASEHACFVPDKHAEVSGKLSFSVLSLTWNGLEVFKKRHPGFVIKILFNMHSHVSHQY